ncbi:MAG: protein kinase [Deltaproteobacteria bacterium]|nr:protein kinase [Deltaproteobacteria bacterium]
MTDEWEQISGLYHEALKLPEHKRATFLKEQAPNEDVRLEVESLLAHDRMGEQLLESPALEVAAKMMANEDLVLMTGRTLGHYRVADLLGKGGMGEVYRARDLKLGREVAIKVLPQDFADNRDRLARFQREAKLLASLNHPHICTIYDIDEYMGHHFIVMELIEGRTLKQHMLQRRMKMDEILSLVLEVNDGLEAAHAKGMIHRDIKPTNIVITATGHAKILDFGLAKLLSELPSEQEEKRALELSTETAGDHLTRAGMVVGTAAYMSPEQALGSELDARTDLFSLGIVLYEMATGRLPFQGDTPAAQSDSLLHKTPTSPSRLNPNVSRSLERIICRMLEKDREIRYQSAKDLLADLKYLKQELSSDFAAEFSGVKAHPHLPSLAVLAFTNMSADKENEYFCDGLSEEIINALCNVRELKVVARTSAFAFKGKEVDIRAVGEKLNVGTVLEGSVRKSGQRLRITAQLINVEDGYHIWSGQFDREMKDIFDIQEEISLSIVDQLKLNLLKGEKEKILKRHTEDPEAYELYLKGLHFWRRRYERGLQKSLQYFQLAAEKDPGYTLPHVGIANAFGILGVYAFMPPDPAYTRARAAANKALEIDPELAEVYASLGWISMWYDRDWPAAETHFKKAIRMKPDYPEAHLWYGNLLACMGRADDSIQEMRKGKELEPLEPAPPTHVGWALYFARRFDESIEELREVMASDPEFSLPYMVLSGNFMAKKMWSEAIDASQKFVELSAGSVISLSFLGVAYGLAGMKDEALRILERLDELSKDHYVGPFFRAYVWTALGEKDKALENLEKAYEGKESFMAWIKVWPSIDNLRSEPRFQALLTKMNLDK